MANEDLGLRLTAQITEWVSNLGKASNAADGLRKTVLALEQDIKRAFAGMEAVARQGGGKMVGALVGAAREMDKATGQIEADAKKATAALDGMATAAGKSARTVGQSAKSMEASVGGVGTVAVASGSKTTAALSDVESSFGKVGERLKNGIFSLQNALLGLGAFKLGQEAVSSASDFQSALSQVNIVAADSGKSIDELKGFLLDLSKTTPIELVDLTQSLGDAIGKLPKGANQAGAAMEALSAAQLAARASGSSAGQVLDGIIPILNTYGKTGITAAEITDKLFAAFDQGGATVPELSASLGQIVGISSQFGISIDELLGEIAVLTRGGQSASEAITNLRQALISTARPPKIVQDKLKELGVEFGVAQLKSKGLVGVLEELQAKGGETQLEQLFTDTQGFLGVATLLGAGLGQVREDITQIGNASGKTDAAVAKIAGDFDQLAGIAKNKLQVVLIDMGTRVLPTLIDLMDRASTFISANGEEIAQGFKSVVDVLASLATFVASNGAAILQFFIAFSGIKFFAGLAKDIAAATVALKAFSGAAAVEGAAAGTALTGGFASKLGALGPLLKSALKSPGILAAAAGAFSIGYSIGTYLMEALGDAIEKGTQDQIIAAIDDLDRQLSARLKALGAKTVEEAAAIRRKITSGQAVEVGAGQVQTLKEAQTKGGGAATTALFNRGLNALSADISKAQAGTARSVQLMADAAGKIEDLRRSGGAAAEIAAAEGALAQHQALVQSNAQHVEGLFEGSKALIAEYSSITKTAAEETAANTRATALATEAMFSPRKVAAAAGDGGKGSAKAAAENETVLQDMVKAYADAMTKFRELQLQGAQLGAEAAQSEADARRAAYEAETDARLTALGQMDVAESQSAALRAERERGVTSIIEAQIGAMQKIADARVEMARAAAEKETAAFADSAAVQAQIAANLATEEATIQAELAARTEEIRRASAARITEADRAEAKARAEEAVQKQATSAAINQGNTTAGRVGGFVAALEDPVGLLQSLGPDRKGGGAEAGGSAVGEVVGAVAGALGPIGAVVQAATKLPEIFNGIAGMLTTGLDDFVDALFDSILNMATALVEGLPSQIEHLLSVTVPAFITALIGGLPRLIGALIAAIPRIAFALVKAITYDLLIGLEEGFKNAGKILVDFFAEGLPRVFNRIIEEIKDFFGADGSSAIIGGKGTARTELGRAFEKQGASKSTGGLSDVFAFFRHQGGTVSAGGSNPHTAAAMAAAGAPRFAAGGMVNGLDNVARRRLSQILSGDDVPALLAPGEGVLTARGVDAVGGPVGLDSVNRGNPPAGGGSAQLTVSARLGGDAALAALISRIVSISVLSPAGNVRAALDRGSLATRIPAYRGVR